MPFVLAKRSEKSLGARSGDDATGDVRHREAEATALPATSSELHRAICAKFARRIICNPFQYIQPIVYERVQWHVEE
jgi:hypothetical protein